MPRMFFGWMPVRAASWIAATSISLCLCQTVLAQRQAPAEEVQKPIRLAGAPLRVNNVPPELLKILKDWEQSSAKVKKLQGEHVRWEYDYVFGVAKKNLGKFYYESPDKGRIDLNPDKDAGKPVKGNPPTVTKSHWEPDRPPVTFKIQPGQPECWICNGKVITQLDDIAKTALQIVIPKKNQGAGIMDGPLPFLFGMPADKALRRFNLTLVQANKKTARIVAKPKEPQDVANYQLAEINLNLETFLPDAVRLIDPAGTKETVFIFNDVHANANRIIAWFAGKPFDPDLKPYKVVVQQAGDDRADQDPGDKRVVPAAGVKSNEKPRLDDRPAPSEVQPSAAPKKKSSAANVAIPSVVDLHYRQAQQTLEELGFTVQLKRGKTSSRADQVYRVERQDPDPKTQLAPGEQVILWLYTKPESKAKE